MSKLLMILVMFSIAGCSNQAIYDSLQKNERSRCVKEEPPTTYFECIDRTSKTYGEYEREREKIE